MNVVMSVLPLLAFMLLTAGTAVFVAAEFSLTALERSTVEANARSGHRRDLLVQKAHRSLSTQLSGAQVGISITTLATGYLAEPVVARLIEPGLTALRVPERFIGGLALALAILIATSISMIFGELVPKNLAVARAVPTARWSAAPQLFFSFVSPRSSGSPTAPPTGFCAGWASSPPRNCDPHARLRSWCRWYAHRPGAARWTWSPPFWWTAPCSSANAPPRNS